jgi:hypothetical protein
MGILPMGDVLIGLSRRLKKKSRKREFLKELSLTRLFFRAALDVREYTHHGQDAHATVSPYNPFANETR